MRRMVFAFSLLFVASSAEALPFTPNGIEWTVLDARFLESGTDSFCAQCDDADPLNDLLATIVVYDGNASLSSDPLFGLGYWDGSITFVGSLDALADLNLTIEIDMRVVARETDPAEVLDYPLPSISTGTLTGSVLGIGVGPFVVEDCCNGDIGGAQFIHYIGFAVHDIAENEGYMPIKGNVHWAGMPYTPVPEPTTLLLLGGGLIGAEWKRRKRQG
jgi:hypothetical protein